MLCALVAKRLKTPYPIVLVIAIFRRLSLSRIFTIRLGRPMLFAMLIAAIASALFRISS